MSKVNREDNQQPNSARGQNRGSNWLWTLLFIGMAFGLFSIINADPFSHVPYHVFEAELERHNIRVIRIRDDSADGFFKTAPEKGVTYDEKGKIKPPKVSEDGTKETYQKKFFVELPTDPVSRGKLLERVYEIKKVDPELDYDVAGGSVIDQVYFLLYIGLAIATIALLWTMLRRSREQMMGGGFLSGFARPAPPNVTKNPTNRSRLQMSLA